MTEGQNTELPGALPLGPPPGLCPGPTGGLQRSADPLLISSCIRHEKRASAFYKLNLEHKNGGMTKCLEKPLLIYSIIKGTIFWNFAT